MNERTLTNKQYYRNYLVKKFKFLRDTDSLFYFVLILFLGAFLFFGYALINSRFSTPYSGDYSQQGIPFAYNFYDSWWEFYRTGKFPLFDTNTYLGADNIFANAFYGLFSPFTILLTLFPRSWIPQTVALTSVLRLVFGGIFFRLYLKYLGVQEKTARLFSLAYAFLGWTAFILWFNSFYEVATFFPLVLLGIEKVIKERKISTLAIGLFLLGVSNYFFFLTAGIFGVIYAGFRYFQTIKERNLKENLSVIGFGILGFAVGFGLTAIVCLPAILSGFTMSRAQKSTYLDTLKEYLHTKDYEELLNLLFYSWYNPGVDSNNRLYAAFYPIASFLFPTISCRYVNVFVTSFNNFSSSIFIFTPGLIMFGVSLYRSIKNRKISHLIALAMVCFALFTPFFYELCGAFSIGYGRWEIVVPMVALAYIALNFDHREDIPSAAIIVSAAVALISMIVITFVAIKFQEIYTDIKELGEVKYAVYYEMLVTVLTAVIMFVSWKKETIHKPLMFTTLVEICVMGTIVANMHSLLDYDTKLNGGYESIPAEQVIVNHIKSQETGFYRIQSTHSYEGNDNLGMVLGYNGVSTFHSFYNTEVNNFTRYSLTMKSDDTWVGNQFTKRTNLDNFLGVRYYITKDSDTTYSSKTSKTVYTPNVPLNYERIDDPDEDDGFRVFKNKYPINFGFGLDTLYPDNSKEGTKYNRFYNGRIGDVIKNEETYYNGVILNNADVDDIINDYPDTFEVDSGSLTYNFKEISFKKTYMLPKDANHSFQPSMPNGNGVDYLTNKYDVVTKEEIGTDKNKIKHMLIVLTPTNGTDFLNGEDTYFMLDCKVRSGSKNNNASVFLIGKDSSGKDKTICFDNCRSNSRDNGEAMRGLYSAEPVNKIIISPFGEAYDESPRLYAEKFDDVIARFEKAQLTEAKNVVEKVNRYDFDLDYDSKKFFVSQIAYSKGWSVKCVKDNGEVIQLKKYNSQGGFVGFVALEGNNHYVMEYKTPNLDLGALITIISLVTLLSTSAACYILKKRKND